MASPNERKLRKLALIKKVEELNGSTVGSVVAGVAIDTVEVVEDVVEDVVEVVEDVVEDVVEVVEDVVEKIVEVVKPRRTRKFSKKTKKTEG